MNLISAVDSFLRVAQTGSFSLVASERGVTQPAISRHISAVEKYYGVRLVHRSTSGVCLTEEGRDFLPAAQQLLDAAQVLEHLAGHRKGKAVGRVRLSVPDSLGVHLSAHLGALLRCHEELAIDLVLYDGISDLIESGLDLEVRIGPILDTSLVARRIGTTSAFLVAAPDYMEGRQPPKHPHELEHFDCITYSRCLQDDTWWFQGPVGKFCVEVPCRLRASSATAVHQAVLASVGVGMLSHLAVASDIEAGRLLILLDKYPPLRLPIYLVYPSRSYVPMRTRIVIDFLMDVLQSDAFMSHVPAADD